MDYDGTWGREPGGTGAPYGGSVAGRWSWESYGSCWHVGKACQDLPYHSCHTDSVLALQAGLAFLDDHLEVVLASLVFQAVGLAFLDVQAVLAFVLACLDVQRTGLAFLDDRVIGLAFQDAFLDVRKAVLAWTDDLDGLDGQEVLVPALLAFLDVQDDLAGLASLDVGLPFVQVPLSWVPFVRVPCFQDPSVGSILAYRASVHQASPSVGSFGWIVPDCQGSWLAWRSEHCVFESSGRVVLLKALHRVIPSVFPRASFVSSSLVLVNFHYLTQSLWSLQIQGLQELGLAFLDLAFRAFPGLASQAFQDLAFLALLDWLVMAPCQDLDLAWLQIVHSCHQGHSYL